ncbi:MAG: redoxin family protein [Fimbriimonadaceae bacterium]
MLAAFLASVALCALPVGTGSVLALDGTRHSPLAEGRGKPLALIFIAHDCPICNAYAPELKRIATRYAKRGVAVELVYAEAGLSVSAARAHAKAFSYGGLQAFLDPHGVLARACGVTITPEAALYDSAGRLTYRGRIDNRYVAFGKQRARVTSHDLRAALNDTLSHKPVPNARTLAVGCFISTLTP